MHTLVFTNWLKGKIKKHQPFAMVSNHPIKYISVSIADKFSHVKQLSPIKY